MGNKLLRLSFFVFSFFYLFSSSIAPVLANTTYSYDADGNLTSDGTKCYTYNDANQLTLVKNCSSGVTIAQYAYDYQGNRIVKKGYDSSGNLQQTTYTPTKSYETKKIVSGNVTQNTAYYFVNNQLEARKNPDNSKNYYLSDNLGSVSLLTDASGAVLENTTYYPFGSIRSGGTQSKQLYTGQINDPETGLDYYNSRYYNSNIRRFTQPDTVVADLYNPQDLNRYSYVNNNPMTHNDPSGHCGVVCFIVGGISTAALEVGGAIYGAVTSPNTSFSGRVQGAIIGAQNAVESLPGQVALGVATFGMATAVEGGFQSPSSDEAKTLASVKNTAGSVLTDVQSYHGNDLRSTATNFGYTLRNNVTDDILKFGETQSPGNRYSQSYLDANNAYLQIETSGSKLDIHAWQHEEIGNYVMTNLELPKLNKSLY